MGRFDFTSVITLLYRLLLTRGDRMGLYSKVATDVQSHLPMRSPLVSSHLYRKVVTDVQSNLPMRSPLVSSHLYSKVATDVQ
jgi:hypothetical protein